MTDEREREEVARGSYFLSVTALQFLRASAGIAAEKVLQILQILRRAWWRIAQNKALNTSHYTQMRTWKGDRGDEEAIAVGEKEMSTVDGRDRIFLASKLLEGHLPSLQVRSYP